MLLMLVGRLVSVMIDICKKKIGEEVCVCWEGGEGEWERGGEIKRRGRDVGGGEREKEERERERKF